MWNSGSDNNWIKRVHRNNAILNKIEFLKSNEVSFSFTSIQDSLPELTNREIAQILSVHKNGLPLQFGDSYEL